MPKQQPRQKQDVTLQKTLSRLNKTLDEFTEQNIALSHPGRSLGWHFLRGILYGLGILTAVAIVIPIVIEILRVIEWVPLLGDFLVQLVERMENANIMR